MKKKVLKKTFILLAFFGLVSVQINAQLETFPAGVSADWTDYNASNGTVSAAATEGKTGDGALKLVRNQGNSGGTDNGNNSGIKYVGAGINADTYKYARIRYKNETKGTDFRLQGSGLTTTIYTIVSESSTYNTLYLDMSGVTGWTGTALSGFSFLVRKNAPDALTPTVAAFYLDEIEFVTSLPPAAATHQEFSGAEGADDGSPGTIDANANGNSNTTGWFFFDSGAYGSFSDEQVFEGDYSIKTTLTTGTTDKVTSGFLGSGAGNPAGAKFTTTAAGKHLLVVNVYVASGNSGSIQTNFDASSTSAFQVVNWDISNLEKGKWHRLSQEVTFQNIAQDADAVVSDGVKMALKVEDAVDSGTTPIVVYFDGLEVIPASDYISTTGTTNAWGSATTWSTAEPTATDIVFIKNSVVVYGNQKVAKEVFVEDGKSLTLNSGFLSLTTDELHTGNTGSVTIGSGASLIVNNVATGKVTYNRELSHTAGNDEGWHLVGSPVSGQSFGTGTTWLDDNDIASGTSPNRGVATYNNGVSSNNWSYSDGSASSFTSGKGYSVKRGTSTGNISFTGFVNTDDVQVAITVGAGTAYNLISNTYASFIDGATFLTTNTALLDSQSLWVWNPTTKDYDVKMAGDPQPFKVAPGQAFFVKAATGGNVTFEKSTQSSEADTFLKTEGKQEIMLNFTDGTVNRYAKVYFTNEATKGFDNGFDGELFGGVPNSVVVFTQLLEGNNEKRFQVQSLPNSDLASMAIPVGVKAAVGKEITFSAEALNLPSGIKVYLEDRVANTFTRLDEANTEYKITLTEALDGVGRFYLYAAQSALSVDETIQLNSVNVFKINTSTLRISGLPQGKASVSLFNILGKQVLSTSFEANGSNDISLPKLATGVYIIKMQTATSKISKKIILE